MAKSKVEKKLRDTISTINDLRGELKKVRKAAEKAAAHQIDKATKSSSAELKKVREEVAQVRDTTARQIADLTAMVARLAPDVVKPGGAATPPQAETARPPAEAGSDRPHGDPLGEAAAQSVPAKKAGAKKAPAKKAAKKATLPPSATEADDKLSFAGEALAASEANSPVDPEVPGTAPTAEVTPDPVTRAAAKRPAAAAKKAPATKSSAKKSPAKKTATATAAKKTTAKKTTAKKTTARKAPAKKAGATSTAKRTASTGRKTAARKATTPTATTSPTTPPATPQNPASADTPAAD